VVASVKGRWSSLLVHLHASTRFAQIRLAHLKKELRVGLCSWASWRTSWFARSNLAILHKN